MKRRIAMKVDKHIFDEIEKLYQQYEKEVLEAENKGYLQANTRKTYLLHSGNFIKWCNGEFEPGGRNK